jgi:transposase
VRGSPIGAGATVNATGSRAPEQTDWFRNALTDMGIAPCIPARSGRKTPIPHDTDLHRKRHRIENTFARLKDWRRFATRYDRCPILFLSACALAATVIYRL